MTGFYRRLERQTKGSAGLTVVVLVLLAGWALLLDSTLQKSPTVDEQSHLFRGVAYLQTGASHFLLGHPLGASALAALPLLTEPSLQLPVDSPAWTTGDWALAGGQFMWEVNARPQRLIFLGRWPILLLTLLLGALAARWGREAGGTVAGLGALGLVLLDPNVLANGRLITGDLPLTLGYTVALYGFWRWATLIGRPAAGIALAGLGLGAALAAKFNAALIPPTLFLLAVLLSYRRRDWRPLFALVPVGLLAALLLWATYAFQMSPWPGAAWWADLKWSWTYLGRPHGAYLAGQSSPTGWWYYFPLAFLWKTPLPSMLALALAAALTVRQLRRPPVGVTTLLFFWLPPLLYFGASLLTDLNIGYRHLLPILPFLWLAVAVTLARARPVALRSSVLILPVASLVVALGAAPHFLPFFNSLAGGPENGWRLLGDSNVDWGQDLPALTAWQRADGRPLQLSYFGTASPTAYGLAFDSLPTWAPGREQAPARFQPFNPRQPAPGLYAISATNLQGVVLGEARDTFAWFRERQPLAAPGHSILIYEVEAAGPPVDVVYAAALPADLPAGWPELMGGNDASIRWVDPEGAFLWPSAGGWLVAGSSPPAPLADFWPDAAENVEADLALFRLDTRPALPWATEEIHFGEWLTWLGAHRLSTPDGRFALLSAWRVDAATDRSLQIFVHAVDDSEAIRGQWDGLDVSPRSWSEGDIFVQFHGFSVDSPEDANLILQIGVYDGETLVRFGSPHIVPE